MTPRQQAILLFNLESHLCSCMSWRNTAWDGTHGEYCQYAELLRLIEVKVAEEREAIARMVEEIGFEPASMSERKRLGIQIAERIRQRRKGGE